MQTSRYDVVLENVTSQDLWLSARKIYKIKPVKILAWIGKELLRPPPLSKGAINTDGCWGKVTLREKRPLVGCSCHSERPKSMYTWPVLFGLRRRGWGWGWDNLHAPLWHETGRWQAGESRRNWRERVGDRYKTLLYTYIKFIKNNLFYIQQYYKDLKSLSQNYFNYNSSLFCFIRYSLLPDTISLS